MQYVSTIKGDDFALVVSIKAAGRRTCIGVAGNMILDIGKQKIVALTGLASAPQPSSSWPPKSFALQGRNQNMCNNLLNAQCNCCLTQTFLGIAALWISFIQISSRENSFWFLNFFFPAPGSPITELGGEGGEEDEGNEEFKEVEGEVKKQQVGGRTRRGCGAWHHEQAPTARNMSRKSFPSCKMVFSRRTSPALRQRRNSCKLS